MRLRMAEWFAWRGAMSKTRDATYTALSGRPSIYGFPPSADTNMQSNDALSADPSGGQYG